MPGAISGGLRVRESDVHHAGEVAGEPQELRAVQEGHDPGPIVAAVRIRLAMQRQGMRVEEKLESVEANFASCRLGVVLLLLRRQVAKAARGAASIEAQALRRFVLQAGVNAFRR
jgi:hypothetical protein